jgi:hypothetical protein
LKVITTVKNNNATGPLELQYYPRDILHTIRGISPFSNEVINLLQFGGHDRGWNFRFDAGTQYDVYLVTEPSWRVLYTYDCQGIINAEQSKTCFITVTPSPPIPTSIRPHPPIKYQVEDQQILQQH